MEATWRWFGPADSVSLSDVAQAGAEGVVTALHEVPIGEVWSCEKIKERKDMIEAAGLRWSVVESVPVHEAIKQGTADASKYVDNYKQTLRNLGACGLRCVCYNFMPVIDWTRTDLEFAWKDGSHALAFDIVDFAAFELHILKRQGARIQYDAEMQSRAAERFSQMSDERKKTLELTVTAGLPGRMVSAYSLSQFQAALDAYATVDAAALRANLLSFLKQVVPAAEEAGVFLAIHPDDPPMPLLGLPRVVSNDEDVQAVLSAVDSAHNGLTFCVGSYGSSGANNVEEMAAKHAKRVHFVHLRNVQRGDGHGSFVESDHLDGDVDMFSVVRTFVREVRRRRACGELEAELSFRPDHGHKMLDDMRGKQTNPGYTAIGRLRGLAECRGLQTAILRYEQEEAGGTAAQSTKHQAAEVSGAASAATGDSTIQDVKRRRSR